MTVDRQPMTTVKEQDRTEWEGLARRAAYREWMTVDRQPMTTVMDSEDS